MDARTRIVRIIEYVGEVAWIDETLKKSLLHPDHQQFDSSHGYIRLISSDEKSVGSE